MKKAVFLVIALSLVLSQVCVADSIWKEGASTSPYSTQKTYKVGDIVYVLIVESTSALSQAGTDTRVKDELSASFTHTIDSLASFLPTDASVNPKVDNKYEGTGKTTRGTKITARIAARVTRVLTNGNIKVVGKHLVEVNDEEQEIIVSGVVRSKDINQANAVYSYQVANAKIVVRGTGVIAEAEQPGWFTRIVNWLF
ncbi:MAG: flagellar basal body L-ring protein FlgH [Candidatus Margulisbacteria bacterium]|nr:flagellar basal body L-ring protein FlgH [Candidatus Margulisiibacteriota bacterium]MBU1021484.1 flagellar basal body L-ring protein FlgH [Candidatus Margulisiibacteriota bacterium]MBU1728569.1 flagellar basal body L-ring protein FlgH [Candidatus Margulisiibacteriota bacterium]MBU1955852.1 flagellar basal body L-ring protein FlgH [Candidatus Margulisiibacteriota bacterium]